ncbi:YchJ family protein [Streptomyces albireticuli]|uniref:UPF0225 protein CK936_19320 n=1 Tax=Streptomyces albireticuli TaxID=1940 RepID=A0A2A2D751_9ACTN|nr:YchJ family metal-binding protein [Streptomyces albireticuli]MCD9194564.1 hypothetical protein [Streptomyces albireticuli]PAU47331.1 hypothetical protein CK936_19320 [Streptomyces albireticuli]
MSRKNSPRPRPAAVTETSPCPCGLEATYGDCCGGLHRGTRTASTAERLMRSRYSAFAVHDAAYLLRTWHPSTRPEEIDFDPRLRWTRLEILGATDGTPFHAAGTVEFRAHYTVRGEAGSQHENSRFARVDGAWVYVDAVE